MSQSRQSNATATPPAGTSLEADTLVEAYAEDLMDEIFDDVDRILAGEESAIYAEPLVQEQDAASLLKAEAVTVPAMIVPVTADQAVEARATAPITEQKARVGDTDTGKPSADKSTKKRRWRTFALGAICLSALTATGIWWIRQQPSFQSATVPTATAPTAPPTPIISEEAAFGNYLKRSLRVISSERSAQTETQFPSAIATAPTTATGTQAAGSPQQANNVIERVFVPLLQPSAGNNNQGRPSNVVTLPPSLPAPNAGTTGQNNNATPVPNIAASNTYELVGVLELGDRSAALFEVNGSSQRVYIGETIGGSGWSIVSINNEEVVVRRNGEVRSIYIGQQF
ncbi:hypothetical protein N836_10305 [Leptolyngbya sp. Heron Island J]|uniref:hypothetical protein n=1 Tax=Leptolyngbya sp. Heron Island J TaxID=1385935 RepID=UPI0003B96874|nr:hypothetical protein [Leptolyngbya sp. Heron Island J]ESA35912.1 hypothetical protein N836_10305 [Leptolyngbya sp. Heron Island J]